MRRLENHPGYFGFAAAPEYLQRKLEDHRAFSVAMFALFAVLGATLWIWDYVTDPVGARYTVGLRLGFLLFIVVSIAFTRVKSRRLLAFTSMGATLLAEVVFVEILNRLDTGMIYGIGGFMLFMFVPLVLFQGFSLRLNLSYTFVAAATPHLLAAADFAHGFQHSHYAVLIWPAAVMTMLVQFAFALNYLRRYESETALELASNTDPMTGVSNRRHFVPLLRQEIIRSQRLHHPVSLLMLDIDHFKKINDTYGHPTGDLVICKLAEICRVTSRQIDVVARLGGEEFAILLPATGIREALVVAERVRAVVEKTSVRSLGDVDLNFTVSIGIAEQQPGDNAEEKLVEAADAMLYQAKTGGRNRVASALQI
ncbi:MAG: GGDEF domain-containing protein [Pseudomonadota bacterium]